MPRVKRGTVRAKKRATLLKATKGYKWRRKSTVKLGKTAILKAGAHAHRDRRTKKRVMRQLWQIRLNAALRPLGISYSKFMGQVKAANVQLDRKILSTIAKDHPEVFVKIVEAVKK